MRNFFYSAILIFALTFILTAFSSEISAQTRPQGKANTVKPNNVIPKAWTYVYEKKKGYGFYVPSGTTGGLETINKVDLTILKTPQNIDIFVLAFKDKTLTKEDLLDTALEFLTELGQKVTPGELTGESDNYAVADATTELPDGAKGNLRVLVGTDVTDNYIMIIGADTKTFKANEATIDLIWGSFEMWSGKS